MNSSISAPLLPEVAKVMATLSARRASQGLGGGAPVSAVPTALRPGPPMPGNPPSTLAGGVQQQHALAPAGTTAPAVPARLRYVPAGRVAAAGQGAGQGWRPPESARGATTQVRQSFSQLTLLRQESYEAPRNTRCTRPGSVGGSQTTSPHTSHVPGVPKSGSYVALPGFAASGAPAKKAASSHVPQPTSFGELSVRPRGQSLSEVPARMS